MRPAICATCRYDPSGTPFDADGGQTCPECGRVEFFAKQAPGPCRNCGYDLSGTPVRSDGVAWVCPECQFVSRLDDWRGGVVPGRSLPWRPILWLTIPNALVAAPLSLGCLGLLGFPALAALFAAEAYAIESRNSKVSFVGFSWGRWCRTAGLLAAFIAAVIVVIILATTGKLLRGW